ARSSASSRPCTGGGCTTTALAARKATPTRWCVPGGSRSSIPSPSTSRSFGASARSRRSSSRPPVTSAPPGAIGAPSACRSSPQRDRASVQSRASSKRSRTIATKAGIPYRAAWLRSTPRDRTVGRTRCGWIGRGAWASARGGGGEGPGKGGRGPCPPWWAGAVGDAGGGGVGGGDAHLDPIAEHDADEVLPHLAADPGLDLRAVVVELHGEQATGVNVGDGAFDFDEIVASQNCLLVLGRLRFGPAGVENARNAGKLQVRERSWIRPTPRPAPLSRPA